MRVATANENKTREELFGGVLVLWLSVALGIYGAVVLRRARTVALWPLIAPAVVATVISVVAYGTPRFRVIVEPSIAVLAGVGIDALLRRRRDLDRMVAVETTTSVPA